MSDSEEQLYVHDQRGVRRKIARLVRQQTARKNVVRDSAVSGRTLYAEGAASKSAASKEGDRWICSQWAGVSAGEYAAVAYCESAPAGNSTNGMYAIILFCGLPGRVISPCNPGGLWLMNVSLNHGIRVCQHGGSAVSPVYRRSVSQSILHDDGVLTV